MYKFKEKDCIFCDIKKDEYKLENNLAFVIHDKFPVTKHHSLIIPKRHVSNYFELTQAEINCCNTLIKQMKNIIDTQDNKVVGYNIGINNGEMAGQTINHCHIHLIPRRENDMADPTGGVRGVIPEKQKY